MQPSMDVSNIRITTYNVLSSHLCEPAHFTSCKPEHLDAKNRLVAIKKRLEQEIDQNAIICLQEVSLLWAGELHSFFSERGYYCVTNSYGNRFNGYMGIAIAVPVSKFQIQAIDITKVSDTKRGVRRINNTIPFLAWIKNWFVDPLLKFLRDVNVLRPIKNGPWALASWRNNQMICARLAPRDGSRPFVVGSYHMPCMFDVPQVMTIHTALSAQHVLRFANGDPVVFCGDFNFKPSDYMYKYITTGEVNANDPAHPQVEEGDTYNFSLAYPFRSAYRVLSPIDQEPPYTNWAQIRNLPEFVETLDYVFLSKHWKVHSVESLPTKVAGKGPFPNEEQPSDHLLLSALLSIEDAK